MKFDIPVVLLLFKRKDAALRIVERLKQAKVSKIYIMADQGRDDAEIKLVEEAREAVENAIDWDCKVIKNYAKDNRGVYANIALGAKWVFEREKWAIFLEDDNLPELSFFPFCKELLQKYEHDNRILWICGTNYLGEYKPRLDVSYMFTEHMLPCGWASWSDKFLNNYDGFVESIDNPVIEELFRKSFVSKDMSDVYVRPLKRYRLLIKNGKEPSSWDYQMSFNLRMNHMLGISPIKNQIKNIGVDDFSEHGGNSFDLVMTKRFCGMDSYELPMPIKHPEFVTIDPWYEELINKIVTPPIRSRIRHKIARRIKIILGKDETESLFG